MVLLAPIVDPTLDGGNPSARERLLVTAERLIAEQGTSVSLREIAAAAGQKNNSAVHYHFGSREALIEAVIEFRQRSLERDRLALLAQQEADGRIDLRALVSALISPMFTTPYVDGATHYARFMEKARDHAVITQRPLNASHWPATRLIIGRLNGALNDLAPPLRELRLRSCMSTTFALLADAERALEAGQEDHSPTSVEHDVLDMLVGLLTAPVTSAAGLG
jgi:AcrR family transcriptional regulator